MNSMLQKEEKADSAPVVINNLYFPIIIDTVISIGPVKFEKGLFYRGDIVQNITTGQRFRIISQSFTSGCLYESENNMNKLKPGDQLIFLWEEHFKPRTFIELIRDLLATKPYTNECDLLYDVIEKTSDELPDGVIRYILNPNICNTVDKRRYPFIPEQYIKDAMSIRELGLNERCNIDY